MSAFISQVRNQANSFLEISLNTAAHAATGLLASRAYALVVPATYGAAFCAGTAFVSELTTPLFQQLITGNNPNAAGKLTAKVLGLAVGVGASFGVAALAGLTLTASTVAYLALTVLATEAVLVLNKFLVQENAPQNGAGVIGESKIAAGASVPGAGVGVTDPAAALLGKTAAVAAAAAAANAAADDAQVEVVDNQGNAILGAQHA